MRWLGVVPLLFPVALSGQLIQGKVLAATSSSPVRDVEVQIHQGDQLVARAATDSIGRFTLRANVGGVFRLTTAHVAYSPVNADVEVGTGAMIDLILRLVDQPTQLSPIEVVARGRAPDAALERNGFYERKSAGFGVFRTPEDIERRRAFSTTDHFQNTSGVRVFYAGIRGKDIRMTRGEVEDCLPRVIIDNVIARRGGHRSSASEPPLDALIQPQDIHALEIYRSTSEIPQEFAGMDVVCGVVLIWTKRGSSR